MEIVSSIRIEVVSLAEPVVGELIAELDAELFERYPEDGAVYDRLDPDELATGCGVLLLATSDDTDEALGCGAVRLREPGVGEIKRMYVRPQVRGQGIATALLDALEAEASALFADRMVLETGERLPEAVELYRRAGYKQIDCFDEYVDSPLSLCMERTLS